jgi:hypothetical protein
VAERRRKPLAPVPAQSAALRLIPLHAAVSPDADTVDTLRDLLDAAIRGELIGLACIAIHRMRNYQAHLVGEGRRSPTFVRGCVRVLDDTLGDMVHGR